MKLLAHDLMSAPSIHALPRWRAAVRDDAKPLTQTANQPNCPVASRPMVFSGPVRVAVVIAFCHSLFFLALWLFLCASAGAATDGETDLAAKLQVSAYQPTVSRDPFYIKLPAAKPATKMQSPAASLNDAAATGEKEQPPSVPTQPVKFELQGTLCQSGNSTALINGVLASLNKSVTLVDGNRRLKIVPVVISRASVTIKVGETMVELRMDHPQTTVELPQTLFE